MTKERMEPEIPASAAAADAALEASENELLKLRTDIEDANDRVLRAQAELDNYRKRPRASWKTSGDMPCCRCCANCCRYWTTPFERSRPPKRRPATEVCWKASR